LRDDWEDGGDLRKVGIDQLLNHIALNTHVNGFLQCERDIEGTWLYHLDKPVAALGYFPLMVMSRIVIFV